MTIEVNSSPSLPPEIWEHICDYFDAETVNNFAQVCREWRSIAQVGLLCRCNLRNIYAQVVHKHLLIYLFIPIPIYESIYYSITLCTDWPINQSMKVFYELIPISADSHEPIVLKYKRLTLSKDIIDIQFA